MDICFKNIGWSIYYRIQVTLHALLLNTEHCKQYNLLVNASIRYLPLFTIISKFVISSSLDQGWPISIPKAMASVILPSTSTFKISSLKPCWFLKVFEWKFVQMALVTWSRWPPCPIYCKKHIKIFFSRTQNPMRDDDPMLILAYSEASSNLNLNSIYIGIFHLILKSQPLYMQYVLKVWKTDYR